MAVVDLKFSKTDAGQHWGFRLVGGADFDYPVVVVKVDDGSIAEAAGLQAGDIIARIGDRPTSGLTHLQVHDLLLSSGLELLLGVRKGKLPASVISEEDYDLQFAEMVKELERSVEKDILDEAMKRFEEIERKDFGSLPENLAGQEEVACTKETKVERLFSEALTHGIKKDKKWSTFMMKPENPVPKPRRVEEERKIQGEPYRVVIKKQPPKRFFAKKVSFDQNVIQVELPNVEESETNEENQEETFEGEIGEEATVEEEEGEEIPEDEGEKNIEDHVNGYDNDISDNAEDNEDYSIDATTEEIRYKPLSEIVVETPENRTTLEEQLREVQKQLQLLSQLPSSVQLTLDSVSKQLASLIQDEEREQDGEEVKEGTPPLEEEEEECTLSERALAENEGDADSVIGEELEEDVVNDEIREIMERSETQEEEKVEEVEEKGLTEEELEAMRREEELKAKKEKGLAMERRGQQMRPIVLPGGRRWTDPEDATPSPSRRPKMSEEKIMETIESNLEVIAGKRKGINFLKYQPPPKNLDYLQRSEVYRMVHDMEPPTKGIVSRPEFVRSVQDYYEASRDGL